MKHATEMLENVVEFQCQDGLWNFNAYQFGLADGLLLALAIIKGEDPKLLDAPDEWLADTSKIVPEDIVHYDVVDGKWYLSVGNATIRPLTDAETIEVEDGDMATQDQAIRNFNRAIQAVGPVLAE